MHFAPTRQRFAIGERQLFELTTNTATLYRASYLGNIAEQDWIAIFARLARTWRYDVLALGEAPFDSGLMRAVARVGWPLLGIGTRDREAIHWSIDLPDTFEAYLGKLRKSTRRSIRYEIKRIEREGATRVEVVTAPDQIDRYLVEGEAISRTTYQWGVGQRLENDAATRERYFRLAGEGRLRCYMLYFEGEPIAFARGEISGCVYNYETPGYVTKYHRYSPGLVLLTYAIADLIENTRCQVFDFGSGGDMTGYKSRFGTINEPCRGLTIANGATGRGLAVWAISHGLSWLKSAARTVLGDGELKRRVKKVIRRNEPSDDLA